MSRADIATLYGLEEEVFVAEPTRTSLRSLYYLARLMWRNPRYYYTHTASNFARGGDIRQGLMSGIEVSTAAHATPDTLLADLVQRRQELAAVTDGYLVPLGTLVDYDAPTNTCGLHIHVGPVADSDRIYENIGYFLPLLLHATACSPFASGKEYGGLSYRMLHSYAIGPLRSDRSFRFQDLIYARRLGTIEIRALDPIWDLGRLRVVLETVAAIVRSPVRLPFSPERYNRLRARLLSHGYDAELEQLRRELEAFCPAPEAIFAQTPAAALRTFWRAYGTLYTYAALDSAYRTGQLTLQSPRAIGQAMALPQVALGFAGYYIPRLPYAVRKVMREW